MEPSTHWSGDLDDAIRAERLQLWVPPAVLLLAWLMTSSGGLSAFFSRVFLGMWIHELGHALTAWWCGYFAFPGPWRTLIGEARSPAVQGIMALALLLLLAACIRAERYVESTVVGAFVLLFVFTGFVISDHTAQMAITFGGDAANLLLAPLLVLSFQLPPDHTLKRRWLHWGFVVIGAFAFCDVAHVWWSASKDVAEIPFGRIDGVGFSDPLKLVEQFGWSERTLVRRYNTASAIGAVVMLAGSALGVWFARARRADVERTHVEQARAAARAAHAHAQRRQEPQAQAPQSPRRHDPIEL